MNTVEIQERLEPNRLREVLLETVKLNNRILALLTTETAVVRPASESLDDSADLHRKNIEAYEAAAREVVLTVFLGRSWRVRLVEAGFSETEIDYLVLNRAPCEDPENAIAFKIPYLARVVFNVGVATNPDLRWHYSIDDDDCREEHHALGGSWHTHDQFRAQLQWAMSAVNGVRQGIPISATRRSRPKE